MSKFANLEYMDCRDNNITRVGDELKQLLKDNGAESYFSGNAVCEKDLSLDCAPLCSNTCFSRSHKGNGVCDDTCNSRQCYFDGGECDYN